MTKKQIKKRLKDLGSDSLNLIGHFVEFVDDDKKQDHLVGIVVNGDEVICDIFSVDEHCMYRNVRGGDIVRIGNRIGSINLFDIQKMMRGF